MDRAITFLTGALAFDLKRAKVVNGDEEEEKDLELRVGGNKMWENGLGLSLWSKGSDLFKWSTEWPEETEVLDMSSMIWAIIIAMAS